MVVLAAMVAFADRRRRRRSRRDERLGTGSRRLAVLATLERRHDGVANMVGRELALGQMTSLSSLDVLSFTREVNTTDLDVLSFTREVKQSK